jgi:hypothetical protein
LTTQDQNNNLAEIQNEIRERFGLQPDQLIFEYENERGKTRLNLITNNPRHNQSFLFHFTVGINKEDALNKMLSYVKNYRDTDNSYTIQWSAKGDSELHTSYFRARNIYEALDKLYFGRDMATITVYNVVMNPVS